MTDSTAGFINKTHNKLRGLIKSLINNRSAEDDGVQFENIHLNKFITEITQLLESHLSTSEAHSFSKPDSLSVLEHNFKDLWTLLSVLKKEHH